MMKSVTRLAHTDTEILWVILAMDEIAYEKLQLLENPNITLFNLENFPDLEFLACRATRTYQEFCWSAASSILNTTLNLVEIHSRVAYIDADCYFFESINDLFTAIPPDKTFAIHEHQFSDDRTHMVKVVGRFNVGVICGFSNSSFLACISRWRVQVIENCSVDLAKGFFGDQKYLDEWPELFPSLFIFKTLSYGLAPWNLDNLVKIERNSDFVKVNGSTLYFYHFHGLKYRTLFWGFIAYIPARDYRILSEVRKIIYQPYLIDVRTCESEISIRSTDSFQLRANRMLWRNLPKIFYKFR
jgi:hypothetical protein